MQYLVFVTLAPLAAIISIGITSYAWHRRSVPGARLLAYLGALISGWLISNTVELITPTESATLLWAKITYVFIYTAEVAWLAFALEYAGRSEWLAPPRLALFCLIPLTSILLTLTNDQHHLIWQEYVFVPSQKMLAIRITAYGPWFWVQMAYNYILALSGALLIIGASLRSFRLYQRRAGWMVAGVLAPLTVNVIHIFRVIPGVTKDFSPIAFSLAGLAFAVGIFRYRLFDLKPIARDALIDRMSDGMVVLDDHQRVTDLNPAACALLGLPADEVIGQPAAAVLRVWYDGADHPDIALKERAEISIGQGEARRFYEFRFSSLHQRHNRFAGNLVIIRDITERKRSEEEREKLIAELDAYAQTVAHDLKNPLSVVSGFADMLASRASQLSEDDLDMYAQRIGRGTIRAINIVDALLLLSSVRTATEVEIQCLDMKQIVAESCQHLEPLIKQQQAELSLPDAWPSALGYAPWVEEVWVNYLSNAFKYGGQPPRVQLGSDTLPDGAVRFWVRDQGPGLTAEQQARLFIPFTRMSQAGIEGHGLGLSIVQRIVEKLGGTVGVESKTGKGSLFFFTLPGAATHRE